MTATAKPPLDRFSPWLCWLPLLLLAWLAYRPGLSGGFLFDDFVNLPALGESGPVDDVRTFWRYLTSGIADPTGRPLALLSFLLDARDWPADPAPFLRTNVLLHLGNASLLFLLLRKLGRTVAEAGWRNDCAAAVGAGMWLLHPLLVSTTLYVVQREAMLPASFVLLGLLTYLHGRGLLARSEATRGLAWMGLGVVAGTILATLCKANGVLLPLLAWVLEATVLRGLDGRDLPSMRRLRAALLVAPSILLAAYLLKFVADWNVPLTMRAWTIGERLLTEPRVLSEYLRLLIVPSSVSTGLFNDGFQASSGLLTPTTTLPALLLLLALVALGLGLRRRAPAWSAALLFFLAGHSLESTSIPLELYFEHRNYLPAMLFFWPIGLALARTGPRPRLRAALATALLVLLAWTTHERALLWGNPRHLTHLWAARNPDSSRAQAAAAIEEVQAGQPLRARARLAPLWERRPGDLQLALNYVNAACATGGISLRDATRLTQAFGKAREGAPLVQEWLEKALSEAMGGHCPGMTVAMVETWAKAAQQNEALFSGGARSRGAPSLRGMIELEQGRPEQALVQFNRALAADPRAEVAGRNVALLASRGHYELALRHLGEFDRLPAQASLPITAGMPYLHERVLEAQGYWPNELAILRAKLEEEISAKRSSSQEGSP